MTFRLETGEGLLASRARLLLDLKNVEADRLGERAALADRHEIALPDADEARRDVSGQVVVSLLETVIPVKESMSSVSGMCLFGDLM